MKTAAANRAPRRARARAHGEDPDADHEHADQERQQGREDEVVDRERQARRQHADEMHGPDGDRERDRRRGQQQAPAQADRIRDPHGEIQADIGSLDRHDQRKRDEPGLVRHRHKAISPRSCRSGLAAPGTKYQSTTSIGWDSRNSNSRHAMQFDRWHRRCVKWLAVELAFDWQRIQSDLDLVSGQIPCLPGILRRNLQNRAPNAPRDREKAPSTRGVKRRFQPNGTCNKFGGAGNSGVGTGRLIGDSSNAISFPHLVQISPVK